MTIIGLNKNSPNFDFALADPKHHPASKCKEYIKQYFVPLIDGTHGVFVNGKYTIMDQTTVTKTYFNRMGASKNEDGDDLFNISKWYFTQYKDLHTITYELNKDVISKGKLNLCPQMKHEYKPYKDFDDKTKKRVSYMLNYILEVLASGHKDQYEYILKWFAYMVKGFKNRAILYLRGGQGVGKSTLFEFVEKFVVGLDLAMKSGSQPLISPFNAILGGKLFVYFEELETFNVGQWMGVSSILKRNSTSETIVLEDKHTKAYTTNNMNNYAVLSNNDAIKDDDGRRYFILDIATHRQKIIGSKSFDENKVFWDNVHKCDNDLCGQAFYCYLMEINTDNFNSEDFPITQSKLDSFAKRLESHEVFLKNNYVMRKGDIKCTVGEFYDEYESYCKGNGSKPMTKIDLNKKLKELGIESYKSNSTNKLKVSSEKLQEIAAERHWVHDTDDYIVDDDSKPSKVHDLDFGLDMPCTEDNKDNDLARKLKEKEDEVLDLYDQLNKMRIELENYKKENPVKSPDIKVKVKEATQKKAVISFIDEESDEEVTVVRLKDNIIVDALKELDNE